MTLYHGMCMCVCTHVHICRCLYMHVLVKAGSQLQVSFLRICHLIRLLRQRSLSVSSSQWAGLYCAIYRRGLMIELQSRPPYLCSEHYTNRLCTRTHVLMFDCHFLLGVNFCFLDCPSLLKPWIFVNVPSSGAVQKVSVHETDASFHTIFGCIPETEDFGLDGVKVYTGMIAMRSVDLCHPREYMQGRSHRSHLETGLSAR